MLTGDCCRRCDDGELAFAKMLGLTSMILASLLLELVEGRADHGLLKKLISLLNSGALRI